MGKIIVRVPATSANLGSGMDSIGIAFHLYFTVIVEEEMDKWQVNHAQGKGIPTDERNLIVQSILKVNPTIHPHQLTVISDVPVTHGLGSSTTAVVAGIKIANALGDMNLSIEEQINMGAKMEGHAESVSAALLGNMVASTYDGKIATAVDIKMPDDLGALMYIRPDGISEKDSRAKLPKDINLMQAVYSSSTANVFLALASQGKWEQALPFVENDQFHEPYRKDLVPELDQIRGIAHKLGIYGTYLSGAGPTIATISNKNKLSELRIELQKINLNGSLRILDIDNVGATLRGE